MSHRTRLWKIMVGTALAASPAWTAERTVSEPTFAEPPRLAITAAEFAQLKASPDYEKTKAEAIRKAEELLTNPPPLPDGPASWIFYYASPENGERLVPISPTEHRDPRTGKIYNDERTNAAYRALVHEKVENSALSLAWAYAYTGDNRYAEGTRRILLKLAEDYPNYPDRVDRWGRKGGLAPLGARRYVQSLDEAYGVIKLAKAYDLTRLSSAYSEADRHRIETDFFRLTADTLLRFNQGINNHQTWYNAGLMAIASVLADGELAKKVLTMPGGYYDQLERSIGSDGLWYEGTLAYHNYAMAAMIELVDAGRRLGWPMDDEPKFRQLFTAPLYSAYPDGTLPAINDSDAANLGLFGNVWTWAWKHWRDPQFAQALARGDEKKLKALLGPDAKVEWPLRLRSQALEAAGLVALRMGEGKSAVAAFIDFGPHGGGHGHFDKLNLMLFANGREWLLDPGRLTYSQPEYQSWVKTTAAHNTVTIGGRNQSASTGRLLFLQTEENFAAAAVESDQAYSGTSLRRWLLLTPEFLVDIFDVKTSAKKQIDWLAHARSKRLENVAGTPLEKVASPLGERDGYPHLTALFTAAPGENSQWDFVTEKDQRLRVHLLPESGETLFTGNSIGYQVTEKVPTLIRRRSAATTRFVTVYDLSGNGSAVQGIEPIPGDQSGVCLLTSRGIFNAKFGPERAVLLPAKPTP